MDNRKKNALSELLKQRVLFIDGGWGISIEMNLVPEEDYQGHPGCHDFLSVTRPDIVEKVHVSFLEAGCDIVETNTFGASATTLAEYGLQHRTCEINRMAASIARRTADRFSTPEKPRFVAGSIGPGTMLPTLGHTDFDSLEESHFQQARGLVEGGVDYLQIETVQDFIQAKAALAACRRACRESGKDLPVALLVTVEKGKTLLGTDIQTAVATFAPYDLLAFGINCSTGPVEMEEPLRILSQITPFPLIVMPNAGFPRWKKEGYAYELQPDAFAGTMSRYIREYGVRIAGGCCGTTDQHMRALIGQADPSIAFHEPAPLGAAATSLYATQYIQTDLRPLFIGERTNASGSKKFCEALLADDWDAMTEMAKNQQEEGAHLLDLSLAFAGRNESADYAALVPRLNRELRLPIVFDTTDPLALETALKRYAGRAVINSINLEGGGQKAAHILELARDFGASVICLCIDERGMARTVGQKVEVAKKIESLAAAFGLTPDRLFFDALTFSLATGDSSLASSACDTLEGISAIKAAVPGAFTILGVSNVSYGFTPGARQILNSVFLFQAVKRGLDAAILHAGKIVPLDQISPEELRLAEDLIFDRRQENKEPLPAFLTYFSGREEKEIPAAGKTDETVEEKLRNDVIQGRKKAIAETLGLALKKYSAIEIISSFLLTAMKEVGERFASGRMQLPFILKAAETMHTAVEYLEPHLKGAKFTRKGSMVLATVRGDIHDIGKNLVEIILKNNGYQVFNIGKDMSREEIIAAIRKFHPQYLGLSGLLVKSTLEMKELLQTLNRENIALPVICGGAALRGEFVEMVLKPQYKGKVFYADDAFAAMAIMDQRDKGPKEKAAKRPARTRQRSLVSIRRSKPPEPPFWGKKVENIPFSDALLHLDRKTLFRSRWKIQDEKQGQAWLDEVVEHLPGKAKDGIVGVYGHFHCRRNGAQLLVLHEGREISFGFPPLSQTGKPPLSRFFREDEDLATFFVVTTGGEFSILEDRLYKNNQYQEYLLHHGFSIQLAEASAAYLHGIIRRQLGLSGNRGRRFSPGYPAWPNLDDQRLIFQFLHPEEIGIRLTENDQMVPEQSVSAIFVHHPQARY